MNEMSPVRSEAGRFDLRLGSPTTPSRPSRESRIRLAPAPVQLTPRRGLSRRTLPARIALISADVVAATAALALAATVAGAQLRPLSVLGVPLAVVCGLLIGLYSRDGRVLRRSTLDELPRLAERATLWTLVFVVLGGAVARGHLTTGGIVVLWSAMVAVSAAARAAGRRLARAAAPAERCLLVGTEASALRLRTKLDAAGAGAVLVGRMSLSDLDAVDAGEAIAALRDLIDDLDVHRVLIEADGEDPQVSLDLLRETLELPVGVSLLPRLLEVVGPALEIDDVHGLTLLGVCPAGLSRPAALLKRGFDLIGATVALILLSPLFALIALRVRLDSSGPAFYRQTRIGRDGAPFTMWKFRTMIEGADELKASLAALNEADGLFKIAGDPRITQVGGWLRRHSLDELPQLLNVLRGEMSLVGPRPLVPEDDGRITGLDRRRLQLTPGMTGRWQILGSARVPLAEMIKLDYLYLTGWSLWSDVKIMARTVPYVLARRGM
jgi:exopolysaccharide biosynthesis polyprenyl glycosylphosphotransferase